MRGALVAAASSAGINGVIQYCARNFTWGCVQGQYYCECFDHKDELFCIGTACVGLESLKFYRSVSTSSTDFNLVVLEIIVTAPSSTVYTDKLSLSETAERHSTQCLSGGWVLDNSYYHVLIGIVDSNLNLNMCDCDARMQYFMSDNGSNTRIASMRVSPWACDTIDTKRTNTLKLKNHVIWNNAEIALSRWVDLDTLLLGGAAASIDEAVSVLGTVYGASPSSHKALIAHSQPSSTSMATDHSASFSSPMYSSVRAAVPLTVLISGTYMGINPCPGVGVARALRTCSNLTGARLIAIGDSKFSDPVFDDNWPVKELGGAVHLSGPNKLQKQWDSVSELILGQIRSADENRNQIVLCIPVIFYVWHDAHGTILMIAHVTGLRQ